MCYYYILVGIDILRVLTLMKCVYHVITNAFDLNNVFFFFFLCTNLAIPDQSPCALTGNP